MGSRFCGGPLRSTGTRSGHSPNDSTFKVTRLSRLEMVSVCGLRFWICTVTNLLSAALFAVKTTVGGAVILTIARSAAVSAAAVTGVHTSSALLSDLGSGSRMKRLAVLQSWPVAPGVTTIVRVTLAFLASLGIAQETTPSSYSQ